MKASSHPYKNSSGLATKPSKASTPPATMRMTGAFRHLDKSSGSALVFDGELLISFLEARSQFLRQILQRAKPCQLKRSQIRHNSPAILDRDGRPVGAHVISTIGDYVKQLAVG